jgi:hypothetical protein
VWCPKFNVRLSVKSSVRRASLHNNYVLKCRIFTLLTQSSSALSTKGSLKGYTRRVLHERVVLRIAGRELVAGLGQEDISGVGGSGELLAVATMAKGLRLLSAFFYTISRLPRMLEMYFAVRRLRINFIL